jgi:hypothetical protein
MRPPGSFGGDRVGCPQCRAKLVRRLREPWSDPKRPLSVAVAACVFPAKVILIDPRYIRGRSAEHFTETVLHELAHMRHRESSHGSKFQSTLVRVKAYFQDLTAPLPAAPVAAAPSSPTRPHPEPVRGLRLAPTGWFAQPKLDPELEYRG